jgi:restriction system protein
MFAVWESHRRRSYVAATTGTTGYVLAPPSTEFPLLVSQAVITPIGDTEEGPLIRAVTLPLLAIIKRILAEPSLMYGIDSRKWEEIIAATYEASGQFSRVTLTPRSGDYGRDLIAEKDGFGSVRLIESVKRYTPGHVVTANDVRALAGVLLGDNRTTKGVVSTTWEFAPRLREDIILKPLLPYRLELVDGVDLLRRLKEYTGLE